MKFLKNFQKLVKDHNIIDVDARVLSGTLINTNSDYSTLIYLPFVNEPCKLFKRQFKLTCKNENKLCENMQI